MAKNVNVTGRVWRIPRLALFWARRGGVFRRHLLTEFRSVPKFMKSLGHPTTRNRIYYQERQLSFDKTPIVNFKVHLPSSKRFHIPCITAPQVDFDHEFSDDAGDYEEDRARRSFLKDSEITEQVLEFEDETPGIDERAEEFISRFYQQMKL